MSQFVERRPHPYDSNEHGEVHHLWVRERRRPACTQRFHLPATGSRSTRPRSQGKDPASPRARRGSCNRRVPNNLTRADGMIELSGRQEGPVGNQDRNLRRLAERLAKRRRARFAARLSFPRSELNTAFDLLPSVRRHTLCQRLEPGSNNRTDVHRFSRAASAACQLRTTTMLAGVAFGSPGALSLIIRNRWPSADTS